MNNLEAQIAAITAENFSQEELIQALAASMQVRSELEDGLEIANGHIEALATTANNLNETITNLRASNDILQGIVAEVLA